MGRVHQLGGRIKLGHHSVNWSALHSFTSASGRRVRISKIDIMGRMRTKRNIAARNLPMVPMYVIQSQRVGKYIPQEEVRKSRCKLTTTIMKRSNHMPTRMTPETRNNATGLVRSFRIQSTCGIKMLQASSEKYHGA